jgi:hypothetical protein
MAVEGKSSNIQSIETDTIFITAGVNPYPNLTTNILHDYESYTYQISVGAVSRKIYNDKSYTKDGLFGTDQRFLVIGESGYTGGSSSLQNAGIAGTAGSRVQTLGGIPEYFVNNLKLTINMPGSDGALSGNTGLVGGSFDVHEPYSLGQLFESLLAASQLAGYTHFINTPFVMKIDFHGHSIADKADQKIPEATRFIPMMFSNITFSANESGSNYTCTFVTANDSVMKSDFTNDIGANLTFFAPEKVNAVMANLALSMNQRQAGLKRDGKIAIEDEYIISVELENQGDNVTHTWSQMPKILQPDSNTGNPKYFDINDGDPKGNLASTNQGFNFIYHSTKDKMLSLLTVIDDVMCHTDLAQQSLKEVNNEGKTKWWTVEVRWEYKLGETYDTKRGEWPKTYYYTIKPFGIVADQIKDPSKSMEVGPETRKSIRRRYDYLFSGRNTDILNYDMNFNVLFFVANAPRGYDLIKENSERIIKDENKVVRPKIGSSDHALQVVPGSYSVKGDKDAFISVPGGGGWDSTEIQVARWANSKVNGVNNKGMPNLVQAALNLKIVGDTYYIPTGGLGDYDAQTMAWEGEEVRVFVGFKTINDGPPPGSGLPSQLSQQFHPFSGIYRVMRVEHEFTDGVYTTLLKMRKDLTLDPSIISAPIESISGFGVPTLIGDDYETKPEKLDNTIEGKKANGGT